MMDFNFGPISRTETGGRKDSFNLTSLPLHEAVDALMAATDRDEFVAWLWHDLFKPLFYFPKPTQANSFNWIHISGLPPFETMETRFATATGIPTGLVRAHQGIPYKHRPQYNVTSVEKQLKLREGPIIEDQFDQTGLGRETRFLQLAFVAEPATNTALLRVVIADAFMETVTKAVADAIQQQLHTKPPVFERVRYVFEFGQAALSGQPTNADDAKSKAKALAARYDVQVHGDELVITHFTPVCLPDFDGQRIDVVVDFTATPPTPERFEAGIFSLVELLTVYQDSRTILMSIPQFLSVDVQQLEQDVRDRAMQHLQKLNVRIAAPDKKLENQVRTTRRVDWSKLPLRRIGEEVDLLAHVFAEQVKVRLIDKGDLLQQVQVKVRNRKSSVEVRLINDVINWPIEQLQAKSRRCRLCDSAFDSALPAGAMSIAGGGAVSSDFTDTEHIGFGGDICPMCRIYALNSHQFTQAEKAKGSSGMRKAYRGAFAVLMPSSHFTYRDDQGTLKEKPPLDIGGRFSGTLQRATFTSQEFVLFNALSRRVIGDMWQRLNDGDKTHQLPLPYLGAILLTQDRAQDVRRLFDHLEVLLSDVKLWVYPFEATVHPAVELAFEMTINDLQKHHTKHTYLKTNPITVAVSPGTKFMLLVDNGLQLEVSHQFFADRKRLDKLLSGIKGLKRRRNWLLAVIHGNDPVTATSEAFYDQAAFWHAENTFWAAQIGHGSPAEQWRTYEEKQEEIKRILSRYPLLIEFFANPRR